MIGSTYEKQRMFLNVLRKFPLSFPSGEINRTNLHTHTRTHPTRVIIFHRWWEASYDCQVSNSHSHQIVKNIDAVWASISVMGEGESFLELLRGMTLFKAVLHRLDSDRSPELNSVLLAWEHLFMQSCFFSNFRIVLPWSSEFLYLFQINWFHDSG